MQRSTELCMFLHTYELVTQNRKNIKQYNKQVKEHTSILIEGCERIYQHCITTALSYKSLPRHINVHRINNENEMLPIKLGGEVTIIHITYHN